MADPFEILAASRVSAPGLIGVYEQGQDRRINQMLMQRKIAADDRQQENEIKKQGILAKLYQPKGGGQSSAGGAAPPNSTAASPLTAPYAGSTAPTSMADAFNSPGPGLAPQEGNAMPSAMAPQAPQAPQSLVDPGSLPPRTDGVELNQDALRELYALDPQMAMNLQNSTFNANKQQLAEKQRVGGVIANAANYLRDIPEGERPAELQKIIPILRNQGIPESSLTPEAIGSLDDRSLGRMVAMGRSLENIIRDKRLDSAPMWVDVTDATTGEVRRVGMPRNGGGGVAAPKGVTFTPIDDGGPTDEPSGTFRPERVMGALIGQESGGNPLARGPMTKYGQALGSTQMLPGTAKDMAAKAGLPWRPELLQSNTDEAVRYQRMLGQAYLTQGYNVTGSLRGALMYYHGGPDKRLWGPKTRKYASDVIARLGAQ